MSQNSAKTDTDLAINKRKVPIPFSIESLISKDDKPGPLGYNQTSSPHVNRIFENYKLFCVNQHLYPGFYPGLLAFPGSNHQEGPAWLQTPDGDSHKHTGSYLVFIYNNYC